MHSLTMASRATFPAQGSTLGTNRFLATSTARRMQQPIAAVCMGGHEQRGTVMPRRVVLPAILLAPLAQLGAANQAEAAGSARDLVKGFLRPNAVKPEDAVVQLMDARGTLLELQNISATPLDSQERYDARVILPGMAGALRKVQDAAPSALQLIGSDAEASLGSRYGGDAGEEIGEELGAVYKGVGQVLTISGRTIKAEAIEEGVTTCGDAAAAIDGFLGLLPPEAIDQAMERRRKRSEARSAK